MTALSSVTTALERAWTAIRTLHPDVQPAAMVVYLHPKGDRLGHYWQRSWETRQHVKLDEVHVSSHALARGADETLHVLLHEAAHSIAATRSIQDVSRQGRYHNKRFSKLAHEMGLVVETNPKIGYTTVGMDTSILDQYAHTLRDLTESIQLWQQKRQAANGNGSNSSKNRSIRLTCPDCGRIIRASRKCINDGPIVCAPCSVPFEY